MPVVYLKSGGYIECEGYTIKEGAVKAVNVKLCTTGVPEECTKQQEAVIPLANILYILPKK